MALEEQQGHLHSLLVLWPRVAPVMDESWLAESRRPEPTYLAMLDILGFRELVAQQGPEVVHSILRRQRLDFDFPGEGPHPMDCEAVMFSDTILMWPRAAGVEGLVDLVEAVGWQLASSISTGVLLRGAIVSDELFVSSDRSTYFGKGVVRAYDLEQGQLWGGAIVDGQTIGHSDEEARVLDGLRLGRRLREHRVAWRSNPSPRLQLCVEWPTYLSVSEEHLRLRMKGIMTRHTEDGLARQHETMDFFRLCTSSTADLDPFVARRLRDSCQGLPGHAALVERLLKMEQPIFASKAVRSIGENDGETNMPSPNVA